MSIVTINLGGKAEVTSGYRSPREILEEVKDVFHINDVRIAITGKTSYVDAYAIDISDTEKLADIAGYITSYFSVRYPLFHTNIPKRQRLLFVHK